MAVRFGRVQLLRMSPNTLRECRWGLHLDNNNQGNPEVNGWVVRVWLELTDDPASMLVLRPAEFRPQGRGPDPAALLPAGRHRLRGALPRRAKDAVCGHRERRERSRARRGQQPARVGGQVQRQPS